MECAGVDFTTVRKRMISRCKPVHKDARQEAIQAIVDCTRKVVS